MQSFLSPIVLTIHLMLTIALIGVVLLQKSEGGLGGLGGGMSGFMSTRGSTNLLTKTTRWLAAAFMVTSLGLAWLASHGHVAPSIISEQPAPAPLTPLTGQTPAPANTSGAPAQPASGAPAGTAPSAPAVPTSQ